MIPEDKFDLIIEILRQQDKRFEGFVVEVNRKFDQIDKRFEQMERQFAELREMIREDRQQLREIHASRDKVKVTFGWQWAAISFSIAIVSAVLGGSMALTFFR